MTPDLRAEGLDGLQVLERHTAIVGLVVSGAPLAEVLAEVAAAVESSIAGGRCSVVVYDDDEVDPRDGAPDTSARWSSPIHGRTSTVGALVLSHDEPHPPTVDECCLVERFARLAAMALAQDRLVGSLAECEERFRRAFEDNAVGMALTALDGTITRVNGALRDMLGRTEPELLDENLAALLDPADEATTPLVRQLILGSSGAWQFETTLLRADGESVQVAMTVSVVHGAAGAPLHLSVNMLDVTARRAAERDRRGRAAAELARVVAERASLAKSDFLTALSHELRTPVQSITGFTEVLGSLSLSPERHDIALGHINIASAHILALVEDVLDIAKIESGSLPMNITDLDLEVLIGEVLILMTPLAAKRGVELLGCPCGTVRGDGRRLRQVLINIVTNGIRYNKLGGEVRVTVRHEGPAPANTVVIAVNDSGPGIAEELLPRLFVPFDRLGADYGSEPGAGLGMALTRSLTEAMDGTLVVRSTSGEGTTVEVRLPAVSVETEVVTELAG